jgi:hypothetical protein
MDQAANNFRAFYRRSETQRWLAVSFFLMCAAAIRSSTFHHYDEHFQILEFAGFKLGKVPESALRWEYGAAMRSWIQPGLYYLLSKAWLAVGIDNPFSWAMSFRFLSGLLTWAGLALLCARATQWLEPAMQSWMLRLQALLWFIPYLSVRTSGETFTTIFLLFAMAVLLSERALNRGMLIAAGFLTGTAVIARFPSAVFALGFFLWLWREKKATVQQLFLFTLAGVLPMLLALPVERWGYGYWTAPMWNYFHQNLVEGKSHDFGTAPFFAYLYLPSLHFLFPLSLAATAATLTAWYRWPHHLFTWMGVAYFVVHSLIAHKEARFLFPIAMLLPFLIPMAVQRTPRLVGIRQRAAYRILVGINLIALVYLIVTPTRKELVLEEKIFSTNPHFLALGRLGTPHPFQSTGMEAYFYRPETVAMTELREPADIEAFYHKWCEAPNPEPFRILTRGGTEAPTGNAGKLLERCSVDFESFPEFYLRQNPLRLEKNVPVWRSYLCSKDNCGQL